MPRRGPSPAEGVSTSAPRLLISVHTLPSQPSPMMASVTSDQASGATAKPRRAWQRPAQGRGQRWLAVDNPVPGQEGQDGVIVSAIRTSATAVQGCPARGRRAVL